MSSLVLPKVPTDTCTDTSAAAVAKSFFPASFSKNSSVSGFSREYLDVSDN